MRFVGAKVWAWLAVALLAAGCGSVEPEPVSEFSPGSQRAGGWTRLPTAPLSARHEAAGVWVADRFVILGGWSSPICPVNADCAPPLRAALRDGASFDPATGRWTEIAAAPVPVTWSSMAVVGPRIYVLTADQGRADSPVTFLSYESGQNIWMRHPLPPDLGTLVAVGTTVVAVPGSDEQGTTTDAVFDPHRDKWCPLPADPLGASFDRSAVEVDGGLLLAAKDLVPNPGAERPALVRLARLDKTLSRWSMLPNTDVIGWGPVAVGSRVVWPGTGSADGGAVGNWGRSYPEGGILNLSSGTWQALPRPPWPPALDCCTTVVGDRVLVGGQLLDPATGRWAQVPQLPGVTRRAATVVGSPRTLLVWGGATTGTRPDNLATGYLLTPG